MIPALLAACTLPLSTSRPQLLCRFLSTGLRSVNQKIYEYSQTITKIKTNDENTPTPLITLRTSLSSRKAAWALIGRHARLHAHTIGAALSRPCYLRWRVLQQMKVNTVGTPRSFLDQRILWNTSITHCKPKIELSEVYDSHLHILRIFISMVSVSKHRIFKDYIQRMKNMSEKINERSPPRVVAKSSS